MNLYDIAPRYRLELSLFVTPAGSDCWEWTGARSDGESGYGVIKRGGQKFLIHRIMYEWWYGPIPKGLVIDHLCRNKVCGNPAHLEAVPQRVNAQRGISKLTTDDIAKIRASASDGEMQQSIADRFGISRSNVANIVRGHTWNLPT